MPTMHLHEKPVQSVARRWGTHRSMHVLGRCLEHRTQDIRQPFDPGLYAVPTVSTDCVLEVIQDVTLHLCDHAMCLWHFRFWGKESCSNHRWRQRQQEYEHH
jgi:hypothetical protein